MFVSVARNQRLENVPNDYDLVTMGIRPSAKKLHIGHWRTQYEFMCAIERSQKANGLIVIDDRQFDTREISKKRIEQGEQVASTLLEKVTKFVDSISSQAGWNVAQRIRVVQMSTLMTETGQDNQAFGAALFPLFTEHQEAMHALYPEYLKSVSDQYCSLIRPICDTCHSMPHRSRASRISGTTITSRCDWTGKCSDQNKEYQLLVDSEEGANRWGIHYLIAAIRDVRLAIDEQLGILHVYGGDYDVVRKRKPLTDAQRMVGLTERLLPPDIPMHYFVGPLVVDKNGSKLSKTAGDFSLPPSFEALQSKVPDSNGVLMV